MLSVVRTASQSCCQPSERLVQHKQSLVLLAWWPSSEIIRTRVCMSRLLAAATIRGQRLFRSRASGCVAIIWGRSLFEGGVYSKKYLWSFEKCDSKRRSAWATNKAWVCPSLFLLQECVCYLFKNLIFREKFFLCICYESEESVNPGQLSWPCSQNLCMLWDWLLHIFSMSLWIVKHNRKLWVA